MEACLLVPTNGIEHISGVALESYVNLISMAGQWCVTAEVLSGSMREKQKKESGEEEEASSDPGVGDGGCCAPLGSGAGCG